MNSACLCNFQRSRCCCCCCCCCCCYRCWVSWLKSLVARLEFIAERRSRGPQARIGWVATRQLTICLIVGMQVLLYPGKYTSHAPSELQNAYWLSSRRLGSQALNLKH